LSLEDQKERFTHLLLENTSLKDRISTVDLEITSLKKQLLNLDRLSHDLEQSKESLTKAKEEYKFL
jgi:hypothetical protein